MKVLIADDDPVSLSILGRILVKWGYEVVTASDGEQAWGILQAPGAPVLAVLDWMMPGLTGPEICQKVRVTLTADPPYLIILTARGAARDTVEGLQAGANDFISKPVEIEELQARIDAGRRMIALQQSLVRRSAELASAQEKILQIQEVSRGSWKQLEEWAQKVAGEVASAIGSPGIGVLARRKNELASLVLLPHFPVPDSEIVLHLHEPVEIEILGSTVSLVPAGDPERSPLGCLVVPMRFSRLTEGERHLISSFARHLASALEFEGMRNQLQNLEKHRAEFVRHRHAKDDDQALICPRCEYCFPASAAQCDKDGANLGLPTPFPFRIEGRYRLVQFLGEGGMGSVFSAEDQRLGRKVAVKIIKPELVNNTEMRIRIEREARLIAQLQHPNVVAIYDSGELADSSPYLIMEFLEGADLSRVIERMGPGTPSQVASVLRQVASALDLAHRRGVIHRDMKPANLFLIPDRSRFLIKVLDFGLAKSIREDLRATRTGFLVGSPSYMSPEQVREEAPTVKSDLFCLASVSYELLTGKVAFSEESVIGTLNAILFGTPVPLARLLPAVPDELDTVFSHALAKIPEDRPGSVGQWAGSLLPILARTQTCHPGWDIEKLSSGHLS